MSEKASINWAQDELHFIDAVRRVFSYLSEYGFEEPIPDKLCIDGREFGTKVTFPRQDWKIGIYYAWFQYELSVGIEHSGQRFDLCEFMLALDPEAARSARQAKSGTADQTLVGLETLSEQLKKYGMDALVGDPGILSALVDARERL